MNKIKPFFNGSKNEETFECNNRVRYIRESCKVLADLWKTDKDFLNKSVDNDISKQFREFRTSDIARAYRPPSGPDGPPSVLNSTIDNLIQIHEYIDGKRREWLEKFRTISEEAREKQLNIRQTVSEPRDNYERALRKFEQAESNYKKFQNRSDRTTIPNYEERLRELEENRDDCNQLRRITRDIYTTEIYRIASEEHSITKQFFLQYLLEEKHFYNDIQQYLSRRIPDIQQRLDDDKSAPAFGCDLSEHCLQRIQRPIAYPIETCIRLLQTSLKEEGLFRIAPSQGKQKKLVAELDLQMIDEKSKLKDLGYNPHVAANTLKQYLRELPDCLLTDALLPLWNEITSFSTEEARVQRIGQLINQLPKVNYNNLCYLIRFLSRVAEYSSENKMTPNNLGICIGCSLLYPKEQSSNSYTNSSIILELMIIHHKQLFPDDYQQTSYRPQPDLIPTNFQSKNPFGSNENLVDNQSPKPSGKHRAPPPPPPPPASRGLLVQFEPTDIGETSTEHFLFDQTSAPSSPTSNLTEKDRRLSGNSGIIYDRPQTRPRLSNLTKEHENSSSKEENDFDNKSPTSNDGAQIPDFNSRTNNSIINPGQTNRIRSSSYSYRDNPPISPGEITQF